jgi:DNA-binding MarR family transcriptional regulator
MQVGRISMTVATIKFDSAAQEAYLNLWRSYDRLKAIEDQLFAQWDLTAQQYNVLRLLDASPEGALPTLSLASRLVSRAPDITRMIDRLENKGWIQRTRLDTDRRTVMVNITSGGRGLLEKIEEPLRSCHQDQLGHLSEQELATLSELLCKARNPHEPEGSRWKI